MVIALLLHGIPEDRIRGKLEDKDVPLRMATRPGRRSYNPTTDVLLTPLKRIHIIMIQADDRSERVLADNADDLAERAVQLAGYELSIYTQAGRQTVRGPEQKPVQTATILSRRVDGGKGRVDGSGS